ncbi:hypothetical protein JWJ88_07320 [Paracoccus methylovorus]|uniref:Uncharacterized protein n=1 Tax=Paracoccus methylovorus TaxID=2812658 RepID=A0ABX7JDW4_9RHOB|nr:MULTISPECIES: hypothetical protein [Paracoccus]QRZ12430.1 hypothetical protein JWJ88_07320 [Paracoccus methylovorus]
MARADQDRHPARPQAERPGNRDLVGGLLPAMPESPIPDWAPRNRTPDPLAPRPACRETCDSDA